MTGSIVSQVQYLYKASGINMVEVIGRQEAKRIARRAGAKTSSEIGARTPICSYTTGDKYRDVWILLGKRTKERHEEPGRHKMFDLENLTGDDVADFFHENVIEAGRSLRTFLTYASATAKLESALANYAERFATGRTYAFRPVLDSLRHEARGELRAYHETREYRDPQKLIACTRDAIFKVAARVQNEGGARVREAALIGQAELLGVSYDNVTGREAGNIQITRTAAKGGRERQIRVEANTYRDLSGIIKECGEFRLDHDAYRRELRRAAAESGQDYNGSHGLRYCFAQRRYAECRLMGLGETEAKLKVAIEMGHGRPAITEWYLGKTL